MGVTISVNDPFTAKKSFQKEVPSPNEADITGLGQTYMNSFLYRYARQSPRKVKDAEKAFIKRNELVKQFSRDSRNINKFAYHTTTNYMSKITSGQSSLEDSTIAHRNHQKTQQRSAMKT